jgi:hypothetical protein
MHAEGTSDPDCAIKRNVSKILWGLSVIVVVVQQRTTCASIFLDVFVPIMQKTFSVALSKGTKT